MKWHCMRRKSFLLCLTTLWVFAPTNAVSSGREPSSIHAIEGMRVLPQSKPVKILVDRKTGRTETVRRNARGHIPGFTPVTGALLAGRDTRFSLGFEEGVLNGTPVLLVAQIHPDLSTVVVSVEVLPPDLIEWEMVGGETVFIPGRYRLSESCELVVQSSQLASFEHRIGLVRPDSGKSDCTHKSRQVSRAWGISKDGHVTQLPTTDLQCEYITMNDC